MPSDVQLIRENEQELYFATRPVGGLAIAAIGSLFVWLAYTKMGDSPGRWLFGGVGALFALLGVMALFWRCELRLDLMTRTWTLRRGFWPSPGTTQGSLDELQEIVLETGQSMGKNPTTVWWLRLAIPDASKTISILETPSEETAYQKLEHFAKTFHLTAVDRTGGGVKTAAWDKLDEPLAERAREAAPGRWSSSEITPPPAGSRIEYSDTPGARNITLPALGLNFVTVFLLLWGAGFASGGGYFLWVKIAGKHIKENPPGIGWVIAPLFLAIGLGAAAIGVLLATGRQTVREESGDLLLGLFVFGRMLRPKRWAKNSVEEVEIKPTTASGNRGARVGAGGWSVALPTRVPSVRNELCVRGTQGVVRMGSGLSQEAQEWLRDAVTRLVAR